MTIDEAIENLKHDYEIDMYIHDIAPQIAEWLEELKANKVTSAEIYESGYKRGYEAGYTKAIDNFVDKVYMVCGCEDTDIYCKETVDDVAEQLKAGGVE